MKVHFNFDERNVKLGLENQFTLQEFLEVTPVKILMLKGDKGDTVSAQWGTITGDLSAQTDLNTALDTKADTTDIPDVSNFITKDVNNLTNYTKTSDLSDVATSGDFEDLTNRPTKVSDLTNDRGFIDNTVDNLTNYTKTSDLSAVAISGDYDDLDNKPTIPSKTSDLTNDSNFAVTNANNNFSASQSITGDLTISGDITNHVLDLFNDTSGSDWKDMLKNKMDYCISNINTAKGNVETFINGGWYGVNYGFGVFSKAGNAYQLTWYSTDGIYYCRKLDNGVYDYRSILWTNS